MTRAHALPLRPHSGDSPCGKRVGVRCKGFNSTWNPVAATLPSGEVLLFYKVRADGVGPLWVREGVRVAGVHSSCVSAHGWSTSTRVAMCLSTHRPLVCLISTRWGRARRCGRGTSSARWTAASRGAPQSPCRVAWPGPPRTRCCCCRTVRTGLAFDVGPVDLSHDQRAYRLIDRSALVLSPCSGVRHIPAASAVEGWLHRNHTALGVPVNSYAIRGAHRQAFRSFRNLPSAARLWAQQRCMHVAAWTEPERWS